VQRVPVAPLPQPRELLPRMRQRHLEMRAQVTQLRVACERARRRAAGARSARDAAAGSSCSGTTAGRGTGSSAAASARRTPQTQRAVRTSRCSSSAWRVPRHTQPWALCLQETSAKRHSSWCCRQKRAHTGCDAHPAFVHCRLWRPRSARSAACRARVSARRPTRAGARTVVRPHSVCARDHGSAHRAAAAPGRPVSGLLAAAVSEHLHQAPAAVGVATGQGHWVVLHHIAAYRAQPVRRSHRQMSELRQRCLGAPVLPEGPRGVALHRGSLTTATASSSPARSASA
jgi:hypothetical protein